MKNKLLAAASALLLVGGVAAPAAIVFGATSAEAKNTVSAKVGKPLQEAQKLAQEKNFSGALAKAKEADAVPGKTPYETFIVKDFLTYIYGQLRDFGNAAVAAEAALATGQAPAADVPRRIKLLAQLNYQAKNYGKAIQYAERYNADYGADTGMSELIAQSYYVQKNFAKALSSSMDLVRSAERAGRSPNEDHLRLALSSAYNLKDNAQTKEVLFKLVQYYGKDDYWSDLFNILLAQTGNNERSNLEFFRAKFAAGQMKDADDYLEAGQTAIQVGFPGEAQRIVQAGFDKGVLGTGPDASRHRRLQKLATDNATADKATIGAQAKAAAASPNGNIAVKVAEAMESYGDAAGALTLIQSGIAKPGIKNMDEARITLGRIQLALGQKDAARKTFGEVKTDPKMQDAARLWTIISRKG
ncbi:MAG: hypothetical protein K2Q06_11290 [Parvularculaceae bacterium]|nr:hypothetical protein [Parvularculaceae bacterium]